jgi:phage virion morphogenesis protein
MSLGVAIEVDNARVLAALDRLARAGRNPAPALKSIGEQLIESTRKRIERGGPGPAGERWAPNSPVTMALAKARGRKKFGPRPLIDSGILMDTIAKAVSGNTLVVGSNRFAEDWPHGAAVFQFGSHRAGRGHKVTIPPRPFIGISDDDARDIVATIYDFLDRAVRG